MPLAWPSTSPVGNDQNNLNGRHANSDARPDFLCVGAQKGGTSWLYYQLSSHADFWMPPVKELHYFDALSKVKRDTVPRCRDTRDQCFLEKMTALVTQSHIDLDAYSRLFESKGALLSGDITPAYSMLSNEIIEQIVVRFPNLKVIFLARDPVERAWSQLSMGVRLGNISPFDATDAELVIGNLLNPGVFLRSHPSQIVARWKRYVRPELFHVYFFDDLEKNPVELRRSILLFLGADPDKPGSRATAEQNWDAGKDKLQLTDKVRSRVAKFFEQELKACAEELGGPAKNWPARYGFSLLVLAVQLMDDLDIFFWVDWVA
jgi:Sulfotransferase family